MIQAVKSKIAYSTDTWTTSQMVYTFAGTIASFIDDDWQLIERLIDFRHLLDDEHEGVNAAKAFMDSGSKRGSLNKMSALFYHLRSLAIKRQYFIALTMDNASANTVLARTLSGLLMERYGIHFSPENGQIRCLAHVVNLVVQQILSALINADDPTVNDWYLLHKFLPFHYDVEGDEELRALEDDEMAETDEKLTELCQDEEKDEALNLDEISNPVQKVESI